VTALEVFNSQNGGDAKRVGEAIEASRATLTKVPPLTPLSTHFALVSVAHGRPCLLLSSIFSLLLSLCLPPASLWAFFVVCAGCRPRRSWRR